DAWVGWIVPSVGTADPGRPGARRRDRSRGDHGPQGRRVARTSGNGATAVRPLPRLALDLCLPQLVGQPRLRAGGHGRAAKLVGCLDPPAVLASPGESP